MDQEDIRTFFKLSGHYYEIAPITFSTIYNQLYEDSSHHDKPLIKPKKAKEGRISFTIPLTLEVFNFLYKPDETLIVDIFRGGVEYHSAILKKISFTIIQETIVVAQLNFVFYDWNYRSAILPSIEEGGDPAFYNKYEQESFPLTIDQNYTNLSSPDNVIDVSKSQFDLRDFYEEESKTSLKITTKTVTEMAIDFAENHRAVTDIGYLIPRKFITTNKEINARISFPLQEELSQLDYFGDFKGSGYKESDIIFVLEILFKDINNTPVDSIISIEGNLLSINSKTNSSNAPTGSISIKQKIK